MQTLPQIATAFHQRHPVIRLVQGTRTSFRIEEITANMVGTQPAFYSLDAALRRANFDQRVLLPGSLIAYTHQHHTLALPFTEIPWAVQWRTDAFAAAHLPAPADDWTIDDFVGACVALKALASSRRLKGFAGALPPLVSTGSYISTLRYPGLWQAFVWGFGGTIATNGTFHFTDAASVRGLTTLVYLAQQFCVSEKEAWAGDYGLAFQLYHPGSLPTNWRWARLPRFPVSPVIPTVSVAQGLFVEGGSPSSEVVAAALDYLLWFYTPAGTALLTALATPPALADPAVQTAYWAAKQHPRVVGDYQHFKACFSGFPYVAVGAMSTAITYVVTGKAQLTDALVTVQRQLNSHTTLSPVIAFGVYSTAIPQID